MLHQICVRANFRRRLTSAWCNRVFQSFLTTPPCSSEHIKFVNATLDGAPMRKAEPVDAACVMHALDEGAHIGLFLLQPELVDLLGNRALDLAVDSLRAIWRSAIRW